jgi:NAD(P)-dependent dehydrogenase (short-subunit alcohol dehydrogenase family)
MDQSSLVSVKSAAGKFAHDRLDILLCNAGIMDAPPALSRDGFEIHLATNHLGHAMLIRELLPVLLRTAAAPGADVRLVVLTSAGWKVHPPGGIWYEKARTKQDGLTQSWARYGYVWPTHYLFAIYTTPPTFWLSAKSPFFSQSKLANIVYTAELARRYPQILSVSVHPGVVTTDLLNSLSTSRKAIYKGFNWLQGISFIPPEKGRLNQLWAAAGVASSQLVNGAFYMPVGVFSNGELDTMAKSEEFATELWRWSNEVLDGL